VEVCNRRKRIVQRTIIKAKNTSCGETYRRGESQSKNHHDRWIYERCVIKGTRRLFDANFSLKVGKAEWFDSGRYVEWRQIIKT